MKAIEHFQQIKNKYVSPVVINRTELIKECIDVLHKMIVDEVQEISEKRHCQLNSGMLSIFNEQKNKWRAFTVLILREYNTNVFTENMFDDYIMKMFPELDKALNEAKAINTWRQKYNH
jgi:hypothetical protein